MSKAFAVPFVESFVRTAADEIRHSLYAIFCHVQGLRCCTAWYSDVSLPPKSPLLFRADRIVAPRGARGSSNACSGSADGRMKYF